MREWCAASLKRINGSEDITLMLYCMSLPSAGDIREYFSEYLGASEMVTSFASDFIQYKTHGRRPVENAQTGDEFISASKKKKAVMK